MSNIKLLQFKLPEHFMKKIDEYIQKVNESGEYPMMYKRSILITDAIEYFIEHDLAFNKTSIK